MVKRYELTEEEISRAIQHLPPCEYELGDSEDFTICDECDYERKLAITHYYNTKKGLT